MIIYNLKKMIRTILQRTTSFFLPEISISSQYKYNLLGKDNEHYFVGYYDKDPVDFSGQDILCHKVDNQYSNDIEPKNAEIGLLSIDNNQFQLLTTTNAMNWQLGSRVQWLNKNIIIFNDVIDNNQCSIKFDINTKKTLLQYQRPFWDISPDKKYGASLNFSRIKEKRPGYGYIGNNIDNNTEVLTVFSLEDDSLIYYIRLEEIFEKVGFENITNEDIYLNHIVWSPCSTKLMTIFHYENKKENRRMIYPVLIHLESKKIDFLFEDGYFSHHTWIDENRILAYIKIDNNYCFAIWSKETGWEEIRDSMPKLDGHPTYIKSIDKVVVDSYPNRLGIMSLYIGSLDQNDKLDTIATIVNNFQYKGANRCDLHPRVSNKYNLIVCDTPLKNGRKVLIIKGAIDEK